MRLENHRIPMGLEEPCIPSLTQARSPWCDAPYLWAREERPRVAGRGETCPPDKSCSRSVSELAPGGAQEPGLTLKESSPFHNT